MWTCSWIFIGWNWTTQIWKCYTGTNTPSHLALGLLESGRCWAFCFWFLSLDRIWLWSWCLVARTSSDIWGLHQQRGICRITSMQSLGSQLGHQAAACCGPWRAEVLEVPSGDCAKRRQGRTDDVVEYRRIGGTEWGAAVWNEWWINSPTGISDSSFSPSSCICRCDFYGPAQNADLGDAFLTSCWIRETSPHYCSEACVWVGSWKCERAISARKLGDLGVVRVFGQWKCFLRHDSWWFWQHLHLKGSTKIAKFLAIFVAKDGGPQQRSLVGFHAKTSMTLLRVWQNPNHPPLRWPSRCALHLQLRGLELGGWKRRPPFRKVSGLAFLATEGEGPTSNGRVCFATRKKWELFFLIWRPGWDHWDSIQSL